MWIEPDDEQQNQGKQSGTTDTSNTSVGSGGGSASSAPTGSNTPQGNPSTVNPTNNSQPAQQFATINDYLGANKQQGEDLGQKVTSSLDTAGTQDKSAIDTAANNTTNEINAGTVNYDSGLVNTAKSDPNSVANNSTNLNSFLNQWNASYGGPQSFETSDQYAPATTAATDATTKSQELADTGGREQLIGDQFGVQGQGNQGLDQAVLQNSSYFPKVQQQGQNLGSLQDYLTNTASNVDAAATTGQAVTDATKTATQNAFANEPTTFQNQINTETQNAQQAVQANIAPLQADLKSGDANKLAGDLTKLNVPAAQQSSIIDYLKSLNTDYGVNPDLSSAYSFNPATNVTTANAATANDYAKAAALQKLTGVDYSGVLNQANAGQAGTYDTSANALDASGLTGALKQQVIQQEMQKLEPQNAATTPGGNQPSQGNSVGDYLKAHEGTIGGSLTALNPIVTGTAAAIGGAVSGIANTINKAFGGGHKDATVNLPGIQMPPITAPTQADAASTKQLVDILNMPIQTQGSYHESAVYDVVNRLSQLKSLYTNGQLTKDEYNSYATPLAQWANQAVQTISGASSQAANSVKGAYQQLQAGGYLTPAK